MPSFGKGFGWGVLSGFSQSYADYAQRDELEKRKKDYELWQKEGKVIDALRMSDDPDVRAEWERRRDVYTQSKGYKDYQKRLVKEFGGIPMGAGEAVEQANVRRQQAAERKQEAWRASPEALPRITGQVAPMVPDMGTQVVPTQATPSPGQQSSVQQQPMFRPDYSGVSVPQQVEIPRPPPQLSRPVVQERLDPERGLVTTPEYEQAMEEYKMGRQADIAIEKNIAMGRAQTQEQMNRAETLGSYLERNRQRFNMTDEDISDAVFTIATGQRPPRLDQNKFYLTPPFKAEYGPYAGQMVRMAVINGVGHPEMLYPTGGEGRWTQQWKQNPTTGDWEMKWAWSGIGAPTGQPPDVGTAPGGPPGPGGVGGGRRAAGTGGGQRTNLRQVIETNAPRYGYTGTVGAIFDQIEQQQPADPASEEGVVRQAARALATGQDVRGFRPQAVQRARGWLQAHNMVPLSVKEAETIDSTYTLLSQLQDMTRTIAETRATGPFNWEALQKSEIAGSTFEALKSLLSKRAFAEAGMLTNQDIKRAGRLLPWGIGGVSLEQFIPGPMGENAIIGLIQLRKFLEQSLKKVYERKYGRRAASMEGDTVRLSETGNLPDVPWEQNTSPDPSAKPLPESYWIQLKREAEAEMARARQTTGTAMQPSHPSAQRQGIQDLSVESFVNKKLGKKEPSPMMPAH